MKKGISPIVSITLLLAIAVISAVTFWFWVSAYTAAPPMPETTTKGYFVSDVYLNSSRTGCISVDVKNTGGVPIENLILEIREYTTGRPAGINGTDPSQPTYINISGSTLAPGNTGNYNISALGDASNRLSVHIGTYLVRPTSYSASTQGFSDTVFTCA